MNKIIGLDFGHGGKDSGAVGHGKKESDYTLKIGLRVKKELERNGIKTVTTRTSNKYLSLQDRVKILNGKTDFNVSIHINSFKDPKAHGLETWYYQGSKEGMKIANILQSEVIKHVSYKANRGIKTTKGLYMIKRTTKPTALIELGFISNKHDNGLLDSEQDKIVKGIVKGILKYMNIKPIPQTIEKQPEVFYRVVTNSYQDKGNANKEVERLKKKGLNPFITTYKK